MKKFIALLLGLTVFCLLSCSKSPELKNQFFTQLEDLVKKAENSPMEQIENILNQYKEFTDKNEKFMNGSSLSDEEKEKLADLTKRFALSTKISEINYSDYTDESFTEDFSTDAPAIDISALDDLTGDLELDDSLNFGSSIENLIFGNDLSIDSTTTIVEDFLGDLNLNGSSSVSNDLGLSDLELPSFDFGDE